MLEARQLLVIMYCYAKDTRYYLVLYYQSGGTLIVGTVMKLPLSGTPYEEVILKCEQKSLTCLSIGIRK